MMTKLLVALLTLAPTVARADVIFEFGGHTYEIVTTGTAWDEADAIARSRLLDDVAGHLVIIDDEAENQAVFEALLAANVSTIAPDGGNAVYAWLGGSDNSSSIAGASEGNFFWTGGVQFWQGGQARTGGTAIGDAYTNWGFSDQEPDNSQNRQDHLAMGLTHWPSSWPVGSAFGVASEWNDVRGTDRLAMVIEWDFLVQPSLFADLNGDDVVSRPDVAILAQNFGMLDASDGQGDLNGDLAVNLIDLLILKANLGKTLPTPSVANLAKVPEPTTLSLTALALLTFTYRRPRRHRPNSQASHVPHDSA